MSEKEIELSIIIPSFNSYKSLKKGLDILKKQIDSRVEIIVIDDYSNDDTFEKLLEYKHKYSLNLRVFKNEKNVGPGESRNRGIQESHGRYITFMDADDYYVDNFWGEILKLLKKDYDCILFDGYRVNGKSIKNNKVLTKSFCGGLISRQDAMVYTKGAPWEKIYLRSKIVENNVRFLKMNRTEDLPFTKVALSVCEKIYYTSSQYYYYVNTKNSLSHNIQLEDCSTAKRAFDYINSKVSEQFISEKEAIYIEEVLYSNALKSAFTMKNKEYIEYVKSLKCVYPDFIKNKYFMDLRLPVKTIAILTWLRMYLLIKMIALIKR